MSLLPSRDLDQVHCLCQLKNSKAGKSREIVNTADSGRQNQQLKKGFLLGVRKHTHPAGSQRKALSKAEGRLEKVKSDFSFRVVFCLFVFKSLKDHLPFIWGCSGEEDWMSDWPTTVA